MKKFLIIVCVVLAIGASVFATLRMNYIKDFLTDFGFYGGTVIVSGKVTNSKLEPISDVVVDFSRDGGGRSRKVSTDENGNYQLRVPRNGTGVMSFSKEGLRTVRDKIYNYNDDVKNCGMHPDFIVGKVSDLKGVPIKD